jgi:hypothetical protein
MSLVVLAWKSNHSELPDKGYISMLCHQDKTRTDQTRQDKTGCIRYKVSGTKQVVSGTKFQVQKSGTKTVPTSIHQVQKSGTKNVPTCIKRVPKCAIKVYELSHGV